MRELIDLFILDLFQGLYLSIQDQLSVFLNDAQALTAIFMLLYLSYKAYEMMVGDEGLEIMPLLRPFGLALVIIFWVEFIDLIRYPLNIVTEKSRSLFYTRVSEVDALQIERLELIETVSQQIIQRSAELEELKEADDEKWYEKIGVDFSSLFDSIKGYYAILISRARFHIIQFLEFLVVTFFQVCSYLVFFLQVIFSGILVLFGPFAFAFSVLSGFRDAYIHWIARFISVGLYSSIAYIIMSIAFVIVEYGMQREIDLLKYVLENEMAFLAYISAYDGGSNFLIISLLVGGLTMLCIPVIATWIITTSGVGHAMGNMARGAAILTSSMR